MRKLGNISPNELPSAFRYYFDREFTRDELVSKISEELKQNATYQHFIETFRNDNDDAFRKAYAERKAAVLIDSNLTRDQIEFHDTVFKSYAEKHFWDIQQKKLFDLQCLWRAEQIKIPEIESTWDFEYWREIIENCKFIPEVTADEVEMYIEFLHSCKEELTEEEWQNYYEFKLNCNDDDEGQQLPEWYDFHNMRTGNGALLSLRDIRGEKEDYYREISLVESRKNRKAPEHETKPMLIDTPENMEGLMGKIESAQFRKMYDRLRYMNNIINSQEYVEDTFRFLSDLYREIPIESHSDWREALIYAKNSYVNRKIAEEIPLVFEEYQMKLSMRISTSVDEKYYKSFYEELKNHIRDGRKLNGEPEDFNF